MANDERAGLPRPASEERREYELDRITARYVDEFRAGREPRLEDYTKRYPQYAVELADFVLYFHAVSRHLPEPDPVPAPALSPAAWKALARIRQETPEPAPAAAPVESLVRRGLAQGYAPPKLAAAVGITAGLLGKLEGKAIAASSIPRTLIERFASVLAAAPDAIIAYLEQTTPAQQPQYFAEQAPVQQQETFLEAVEASDLDADSKRTWVEITQRDIAAS